MRIVDLAFLPNLVKNRRITERDFNQRAQHPFGHFHFTRHKFAGVGRYDTDNTLENLTVKAATGEKQWPVSTAFA